MTTTAAVAADARKSLRPPEPLPPFGGLFTVREYLDREHAAVGKSEYIAGEILAMAGGSPLHSSIASDVLVALSIALRGSGCRANNSDLRVRIADGAPSSIRMSP
jgi:Uma2 family endonuclease